MVTKITILLKSKNQDNVLCDANYIERLLHNTALAGIFSIFYPAHLWCFVMVSIRNSDFNKNRLEQD